MSIVPTPVLDTFSELAANYPHARQERLYEAETILGYADLYHNTEDDAWVGVLTGGLVRRFFLSGVDEDGGEIVDLDGPPVYPGELLFPGRLALPERYNGLMGRYAYGLETLTPVRILAIDLRALTAVQRNEQAWIDTVLRLLVDHTVEHEHRLALQSKTVRLRFLYLLLRHLAVSGERVLRYTHEMLGQALGVNGKRITSTLKELRARGAVASAQSAGERTGRIEIADPGLLLDFFEEQLSRENARDEAALEVGA